MKSEIEFTKTEVKKYIDECIVFWRRQRDLLPNSEMPKHYIDAYQSMRISLFGKKLLSKQLNNSASLTSN